MKINSSYLLATKAAKIVPDDDMDIGGDGKFYPKNTTGYLMFPISWWETIQAGWYGSYININSGSEIALNRWSTSTYPNGWAILYYSGTWRTWWYAQSYQGGGVMTGGAAIGFYLFNSRADAIRMLRLGKKDRVIDSVTGSGETNVRLSMYYISSELIGRAYAYSIYGEQISKRHPSLPLSTLSLCRSSAQLSFSDNYGTTVVIPKLED